jgi:hypothetical protein
LYRFGVGGTVFGWMGGVFLCTHPLAGLAWFEDQKLAQPLALALVWNGSLFVGADEWNEAAKRWLICGGCIDASPRSTRPAQGHVVAQV